MCGGRERLGRGGRAGATRSLNRDFLLAYRNNGDIDSFELISRDYGIDASGTDGLSQFELGVDTICVVGPLRSETVGGDKRTR